MEAAMSVIKQAERSTYVDVEGSPWEPTKFPGVWQKMLYKEEDGSAFTALMKFEPGARLPKHAHTDIEQTFVLQGSLVDEDGACTAGNFVWRRSGSVHDAWSPNGGIFLGIFRRPNQFFE